MYTDFFFPSHVVASNAWSLSFKGEALHTTFYDVYRIPNFFLLLFPPILCRYKQNMEFIVTKAGRYNILRLKEP